MRRLTEAQVSGAWEARGVQCWVIMTRPQGEAERAKTEAMQVALEKNTNLSQERALIIAAPLHESPVPLRNGESS